MVKVAEEGAPAAATMTTGDDDEVHPSSFLTVKLCVPAASPDMVVVAVLPVIAPGLMVQFPEGRPERATLPVGVAQVGCVTVPTTGAEGVTGCTFITISADSEEMHVASFVTVNL